MQRYAKKILAVLKNTYPNATCALVFHSPLELMVATILSAQCTDVRVNQITPKLFKQFPSVYDYANVPIERLEDAIRSTGFFHSKAKNIQNSCREIIERFDAAVPDTMESLVSLPGIGRKTANVILSNVFGKNEGVVVDTHVLRVSRRIGLSQEKTPEKIERELMNLFPKNEWTALGHCLVFHGRQMCQARKPKCEQCPIQKYCNGYASMKQSEPTR